MTLLIHRQMIKTSIKFNINHDPQITARNRSVTVINTLLDKLINIGIRGKTHELLQSYLRNRISAAYFQGCSLNLNLDLNHGHEPVFLTKTRKGFELAMPQLVDEEGVFKLAKGDQLYVACPGNKNEIKGFPTQSAPSTCVSDKTLQLQQREIISVELECKKKVFTTLKETNNDCGNYMGKEIQLGFEVEGWHPLVTLCYDHSLAGTLHTTHILYGSTLRGAEIKGHQTYFNKGPHHLYQAIDPSTAYKQATQRETLARLLGEEKANYMLARSYLARSHLSPDGDFLLGSWQHLTYFYINTAPMWQTINGGHWLKLETTIRNFAKTVKEDFVVTTGTYGVMETEDSRGSSKKIFLDPNQELIPVPKLFWKILANPNKNSCIVFLVHNNPFLSKKPSTICKNICQQYGWPTDMESVAKGFTYCCSYDDFKETVNYAPELNCKNILDSF